MAAGRTLSKDELATVCGGTDVTQADVDCVLAADSVRDLLRWRGGDGRPLVPVRPSGGLAGARVAAAERVCRRSPLAQAEARAFRLAGAPRRPLISFTLRPE